MSELRRTLIEDIYYPPHEKRRASALYRATHKKLVYEMNESCWICGITHKDWLMIIDDQEKRRWQLETHHDELEWAAANGVDLEKISQDFNEIMEDRSKLRHWLDSEGNMLVLCATHHRGGKTGVHCITYPAWKLQRWQGKEWQFIQQPEDWRTK